MGGSVTVVIVHYRCVEAICRLLGDLGRDPEVARIIVIDNASSPLSARRLQEKGSGVGIPFTLIENPENRGFARAVNQGLALLATPYALVLNPDCRIPEPVLPRLVAVMERMPQAGLVGCRIVNPDGTEQRGDRRLLPDPARSLFRVLGLGRIGLGTGRPLGFDLAGGPLPEVPVGVEAISGAFLLVRGKALAEVGGMDEGYFLHGEDLDWCHCFHDRGWLIVFVPDVSIIHAGGLAGASRPLAVLWHKHRGMWRYYLKFHGAWDPWILRALVLTGIALRLVVLSLATLLALPFRQRFTQASRPDHAQAGDV